MSSDTDAATEKHPVDQVLPLPADVRLRAAARAEHVRRRRRRAADRRHRAQAERPPTSPTWSRPACSSPASPPCCRPSASGRSAPDSRSCRAPRSPPCRPCWRSALARRRHGRPAGHLRRRCWSPASLGFLIAPVFTRLLRFFPEVVTGTVITVIGISLLPVAIRWAGGGTPGTPNFGAPKNIALAAITMAIIVLIYRFLPGVLQPGGDPARPGARHGRGHPVRPDRLQPDRRREHLPADRCRSTSACRPSRSARSSRCSS